MSTEAQNVPTNSQGFNWGIWKADWKQWWGNTLGWESLEKAGMEERKKLTPHPRNVPLKKGNSSSEDVSIGVHGSRMMNNPANTTHFIPEWKYPSYERNKFDDEIYNQLKGTPKDHIAPTKEYITGHPSVTGTPSR